MSKVDKKALADESYQKTLTRLENIKKHFRDGQGSGKLKDKVCVITGVGSLKGIGCVLLDFFSILQQLLTFVLVDVRPHCCLLVKVRTASTCFNLTGTKFK